MIIFLDFDGVTHPVSASSSFREECIKPISFVVEKLDADLVLTTSWREIHNIEKLKTLMGPLLGDRAVGVTPVLHRDPFSRWPRAREVHEWLLINNKTDSQWLALEDEKGNYPEGYSYLCNNRTGFQEADIDAFLSYAAQKRIDIDMILRSEI